MSVFQVYGLFVLPLTSVLIACDTSYRPGYFVENPSERKSKRRHYPGIPKYLEITDSVYIERELAESFRWTMNIQQYVNNNLCYRLLRIVVRSSALKIAQVYNMTYGAQSYPSRSTLAWELKGEYVTSCFCLYSLLKDKEENGGGELWLPHHETSRRNRYHKKMKERNERMAGTGQPHCFHACDLCLQFAQDEDGQWSE